MNRIIVLDLETTGLDFLIKDRIVEIGAVELINNNVGKKFHYYINPGISISPESIKIHGITDEMLADKPKFCDIVDKLLDFLQDSLIVAHNSEFDRSFLNLELFLNKKEILPKKRFIDSLSLAKKLFNNEKNSLDDLCSRLNIDNSKRINKHGALIDAELLVEVYLQLDKILKEEISKNNFLFNNQILNFNISSKKIFDKENKFFYRKYNNSKEELEEHTKFLNNIKNAMWLKISH